LVFDGAGNSVTLSDSLVNSSDAGLFQIRAIGSGNNTFDGSALTSTRTLIFYSGTGADTLKGGQGNDAFVFTNPGDLTAADTVSGGVGDDAILFVNGGIVAANAFNNVTGIEEMALSFSGNSVTLTDALVAGSSVNAFAVAAQGGTNVVDASGVTNGISITFIGATGADTFKGGNGSDGFVLDASMLTSADTIQGGGGTDAIYLQGSGTVASSAFTNVTGVEILVLQGGDSNITLNNASALTSSAGAFFIVDNASNNTIDASAFRTASINVIAGSGNDSFKGGDANDVFSFNAADLTAADTVIGGNGAGADTLVIKNNGTVTTAASAGVSQIEAVQLAAGGEFDFANSLANDLAVFAIGSGAVDKLDASAVTSYALQMFSNGGADTLIGGSQNDTFRIADAAFAAINGNGGIDRITLTTPSQSFNLTANAAKITNVEVIDLTSATAATLSLNGNDISLVNASGNSLYVVGDADDTVGAGLTPGAGLGFTLIASGVINNAVAPGHTFNEYQHSSGALLFVDSAVLLF
jgi:Ca2+-binding RTX toxin-like protein